MRILPAIVLLLAACHSEGRTTAPADQASPPGATLPPGGPRTLATQLAAVVAPAAPAGTTGGRRRGVPHHAQIVSVVVDREGTRALSRDQLGGVRIWPALDGTREPQRVPVRAPEAMAIAARGDGSLAALIDAAGVATILRFDGDGLVVSTATVPPDVPLAGVVVLPGGERIAAVRSDQRLVLLDSSGVELAHLALRGSRAVALHAAGDGLVAVLRRSDDGAPVFALRRLAIAGDGLAWRGVEHRLADPVAWLPGYATATSPDGTRFAYVARAKDGPQLRVVDATTGAATRLDAPAAVTAPETAVVGFVDDSNVELSALGGTGWRVELTGDQGIVLTAPIASATSTTAYARGLRVAGYSASLALHRGDGDVAYLGHRELYPTAGTLAPDGSAVAWATSGGAAIVQRFDGSADVRIKGANDWFRSVAYVDEHHVLVGRNNGQLALIDVRTGAERGARAVAQAGTWVQYEPSTHLAAIMRDTGVLWLVPVDPAATTPLGEPVVVADGATTFALLDPALAGGAVLATVDAQSTERRYRLDELTDGVGAAEMKRERVAIGAAPRSWDRAGRHYVNTATGIEVRDRDKLERTITLGHVVNGIFPSPDGERIAFLDAPTSAGAVPARAVDRAGKALWTVAPAHGAVAVVWSADGSRAIVQAQGGALVLDAATGHPLATPSGWAFALTPEIPTAVPPNLDPGLD